MVIRGDSVTVRMNNLVVKLVLLRVRLMGVIKVVSDAAIDVCGRFKFKL